jgi:hypothetical protein
MDLMIKAERTAPDFATLIRSLRRGDVSPTLFTHGLRKARLETDWDVALTKLRNEPLAPAELAAGIHRNIIPDPGYLVGQQPGGDRKVEAFPPVPIDANLEAQWAGLDHDHLRALVGLQGLPMGPHEAAQAQFRGIITFDDYLAAIAQSNTRNEWFQAIYDQSRQIPTTHEFVENYLRGYSQQSAMIAGAARHGMSADDVNVIFQNAGRPLNIHQITTGLARGGHYQPIPGELPDPYEAASHESNLKPSYYDLNIANKYVMPSVLAIRQLATSGAWNFDTTHERLLWSGWYPPDAEAVARFWTTQTGSSAKTVTVSDALTLYEGGRATEAATRAELHALGYAPADVDKKIDLVAARRVVGSISSAVTDLHAAFKKNELNRTEVLGALAKLAIPTWAATAMVDNWDAYVQAFPPPPTTTATAPAA